MNLTFQAYLSKCLNAPKTDASKIVESIKNNFKLMENEDDVMSRLVAILNLGNNPNISIDEFSTADQIIIYTKTAEALKRLGGLKNAEKLLARASALQV